MFGKSFKKYLPAPDKVSQHKMLRWLGPTLTRPSLWQANRRSIALGLAIGVFMGLIIPLAQIPLAALGAILLRANLPVAVASTLVTNPFTFAPVYFLAYQLGDFILSLGEPVMSDAMIAAQVAQVAELTEGSGLGLFEQIGSIGAPLFTGLFVLASVLAVLVYVVVSGLWRLGVLWRHRKRRHRQTV
jgi:uncharacterized protein (DUF2062 family)